MTWRGGWSIWGLALVLAVALAAGLAIRGRTIETTLAAETRAPVVVIGSSLMLYAIPFRQAGPAGLLGDGRAHIRLGVPLISEQQTIALIADSLDKGARTILVEVNAFAFDLADRALYRVGGARWTDAVYAVPARFGRLAKFALKDLLGLRQDRLVGKSEPDDPDRSIPLTRHYLAQTYPLVLRGPREAGPLAAVLARARARGVEIVLVAPPRARSAIDYMGDASVQALRAHLFDEAQSLGLPLFAPEAGWPDDDFVDQAHLSRRGRTRFLAELAAWWSRRS